MPRNVEIKARVLDFAPVVRALGALGAATPFELSQEDTFFRCEHGRLKLRKLSATAGELIAYVRPDATGPKESAYLRVSTAEPDLLCGALAAALGIAGVVRKQRTVYLVGRTRVHLDAVEGLGRFVELEVVLDDAEPAGAGTEEARALMSRLGIGDHQLVAGAYVDLLAAPGDDSALAPTPRTPTRAPSV